MDGKIILARKRSADPAQEKLREDKAIWNRSVSDLIAKVIAFKRGLNGRGEPRVGLPPSTIKEPFPPEIGSYLNNLADNYLSVIQGAEQIIVEQARYSETRRKAISPTVQMVDDGLVSEASWWGSRMWAKAFRLKGENAKNLSRILDASSDLKRQLFDLENVISSSNINAVPDSFYLATRFVLGSYNSIAQNFSQILAREVTIKPKKLPSEIPSSPDVSLETPLNSSFDIDFDLNTKILREEQAIFIVMNSLVHAGKLQASEIKPLIDDILAFKINSYKKKWNDVSDELKIEVYNDFIKTVEAYNKMKMMAESVLSVVSASFKDMVPIVKKFAPIVKHENLVLAHNSVSRYLKRKWLERPIFRNENIDSAKVLTIEEIISCVKYLTKMMDLIESKNSSPEEETKLFESVMIALKNFAQKMNSMAESLLVLAEIHNNESEYIINKMQQGYKGIIIKKIKSSQISTFKHRIQIIFNVINEF